MSTYTIRRATQDDLDDIVDLRLHAEQWLHQRGINQWTVTQRGMDSIRTRMDAASMYAIDHEETLIGSVTLDGPDLDFWTPQEAEEPALYLYKLMIYSAHRGCGLGDAVLDWACAKAEGQDLSWLRIDVWKTNTKLHEYYRNRGFEYVRTAHASGRNSGALFQRPTNVRLATPGGITITDITEEATRDHPQVIDERTM